MSFPSQLEQTQMPSDSRLFWKDVYSSTIRHPYNLDAFPLIEQKIAVACHYSRVLYYTSFNRLWAVMTYPEDRTMTKEESG
jgi:hypothetical protein